MTSFSVWPRLTQTFVGNGLKAMCAIFHDNHTKSATAENLVPLSTKSKMAENPIIISNNEIYSALNST